MERMIATGSGGVRWVDAFAFVVPLLVLREREG